MRTRVPEKLLSLAAEIEAGHVLSLTRLSVLEPWFEYPGRLPAFGLWIAKRAAGRKGQAKAAAGELLDEARALLGTTATREGFLRTVEPGAARLLHDRSRDFQNEIQERVRGPVRIIHCRPLLLVEQGLALYLDPAASPAAGCQLAADFCQHRDSVSGDSLCGPSRTKVMEVVRFMFMLEAIEDE